jgi:hypothetical protein
MFLQTSSARTSGNKLRGVVAIIAVLLALGAGILYAPAATATVKQMLHRAWPGSAKFTAAPCAPKTAKATAPRNLAAPAGNLNIARQGHAAIRLSDGKILVIGGENANGLIRESEIFNPATHSFITAASLDTARTEHTLTPLADGRILVSGGRGQAQPLRTTEIYNYNGNVFTPGPSLNRPRAGHTATVLSDGRILIAGGSADGSAKIYNPATQSFTVVTGRLNAARSFHGAVLLNNGKVLLAGGKLTNGSTLNSAELFTPATQTFTSVAKPMGAARVRPVLNKLRNGHVQVIGGGEATMEMFNATGEYFTAYAHLPNNAATQISAGTYAVTADFVPTDTANYNTLTGLAAGNFVINKAAVTATAGGGSATYDGATKTASACAATGAYTGDLTCANSPASVGPGAGATTISPVVSGTGLSNFEITSVNGSYTINKAPSITTITCPTNVTYTGAALTPCSATVTGAGGLNQSVTVSYTNNANGGTATANASFGGNANHTGSNGSATFIINKAVAMVTVTGYTGTYDALAHGATAVITGVDAGGAAIGSSFASASFTNVPGGTANWTFTGGTNYTNQSGTAAIAIIPAPTTTTVNTPVPSVVQYSDLVTLSATVTVNNGYGATLAGTVQFKINGVNRGVPVPLPANGSSSQPVSLTLVVTETPNTPPNTYPITAVFTPSNSNYVGGGSNDNPVKTLKVRPENANPDSFTGAYTGQLSAWTPTSTSNTATMTLAATIKDDSVDNAMDPYYGDITKAKITFALRNSTGVLTPITGATNLPVGLVNAGVSGTGTASAIVQFSLSSSEVCGNYTVAVMVGGNYNMPTPTFQDTQLSVCRATPGSMVSNPAAQVNATGSAGFIAGSSVVQFDVKYNKSVTNPQGKVRATITSNLNAATGLVDGKTHTYVITTNSIASLSVNGLKANFAAKANVVELVTNPDNTVTAVNLDGNCTLQLAVTDSNSTTTKDTLALTVNKSSGGLCFSSNWVTNKRVEKAITSGGIKITP